MVKPVQVEQKQNAKGIGYGTEGIFAPWWDDLYTKTAVEAQIKSKDYNKQRNKGADKISKKLKKDKTEKKENIKFDKVKKKKKEKKKKEKRSKENKR